MWLIDEHKVLSMQASYQSGTRGDTISMRFSILLTGPLLHFDTIAAAGVSLVILQDIQLLIPAAQLEALGVISPLASIESSSIGSGGPIERSLSPKASINTMESYVTVAASLDRSTNPSIDTIMHHANSDISHSMAAVQDDTTTNTIDTESSAETEEQDLSSPLRARIVRPFTLPRPGTPPPSTTPPKLIQLPPMIPPTDTALNTLASKESFASLIRNHLPNPDPSAFQLHELVAEPRPATPLRTRSTSLGILNNVLSSAKNRRKRSSEGSGSEEVQSPASNVEIKASELNDRKDRGENQCASPGARKSGEGDKGASPKGSKASEEDCGASPKVGDEGMHRHKSIESEGVRRRVREEKRRSSTSGGSGSGNSGSQEGEKSEKSEKSKKKRERKQVHLWEQL